MIKRHKIPQHALEEHLQYDKHKSPITRHLREVVYGGIDGIITTFAIVAGFTGATGSGEIGVIPIAVVLIFGLSNLFADGFSMGVGEFLSTRASTKLYEQEFHKEQREIEKNTEFEAAESVYIFEQKGFTKEQAQNLVSIFKQNPAYWTEFMMRYEHDMSTPERAPFHNALATFCSFIFFGFIPLLPYLLGLTTTDSFLFSAVFAVGAMALLGAMRARITHELVRRAILENVGLGVLAGAIAFGVGTLVG